MRTTGAGFTEEHRLADGTRVRLRHIRPEDADELRRGFEQLSPASRYRRFLGGMNQLSDEIIRYLTRVDGEDHVAIVAARTRADGAEEGLGVARFVRVRDEPTIAEPAITVLDGEQHKGIGYLLAATLGRAAQERGISCFRGEVLANNDAVRNLLRDIGADLHREEQGRVVFDIALDRALAMGAAPDAPAPGKRLLAAASTWLDGLIRHRMS